MSTELKIIGTNVTRPDAHDKVTGGKNYPVNFSLPGMLHTGILRSPYAHAKIVSIDTTEAEKLPGVKAVLTPDDVPQRPFTPVYFVPAQARSMVQDFVIMSDTVRWVGQPVAAVAAVSPEVAAQALELIDVEYDELPAVFDPEEAVGEGAPRLWEHAEDNIAKHAKFEAGDLEAGFAEADHVFEGCYQTQRVHTCYMEPRVCVAEADSRGRIKILSSMQHSFGLREKLAFALGIPESDVNVIKPDYIGGGFGGKLDIGFIEPIASLLALKTGRPVRAQHTRAEDFISTTRNPIKVYLKTGVKNDGTFTARYIKSVLDCGAHATHGSEVIMVHGLYGTFFPWNCPNQTWEGYTVYTNNMIGGGYRGYGAPQGCFAVESQNDEICEKLGLDPIEFRLKNTWREGDPHPVLPGHELNTYRLQECLEQGAERSGFRNRGKAGSGSGIRKRGIGFACHPLWVSGCVGFPDIYEHAGATVKLNRDGTADVVSACVDIGSGQNTMLTQVVAEELSLAADRVRLVYADTDTAPFDAPTHASRATYSAGTATRAAAVAAKKRLFQAAAAVMEANADDLELRDGKVAVKGDPSTAVPMTDIIERAESPFIQTTEDGPAPTTLAEKGTIIGTASMAPPSNPSPCAAEFVEVEVDTETGEVDVLNVVYAHDIGRVFHPKSAEGQVEGGFQQGMGYALMEHIVFDPDTGACLTGDFLDYKMPTAVEMPRNIESIFIESIEPTGPFGAKSLSEMCIIVPAPAIANAIYNAVGVRVKDLPITPEKILRELGRL
ncbi:xanthine dehydrogenase family protein molybdopterin-binding subunit [Elongatibacter sediminis]|uniref:Molybdopterin cofactor-binding domain-containing protein n=1 Tax=Elongatibacter sediminis TaxID=3119006 RepID=A0AAW9R944_9GAMM